MPAARFPLPRRLAAVAAAAGLLAACSIGEPAPADHFYRLTVAAPAAAGAAAGPVAEGIAMVQSFEVSGVLNQRALLWTTSGVELQQYSYHFWSEPPARALQDALVQVLRDTGAFTEVVTPGFRQRPDWTIQARVNRLELVGPSGSDSGVQSARVAISFTVTDGYGETVVLTRSYEEEPAVGGGSVAEGARALSTAVETIYGRFLQDLRATAFTTATERPLGRPRR
ncbi:ABC-type transport auxiliary lipoprotein family protein [Caenispirillum bisanense]|uniref:ABC-type transport auxiliary lipoprotein family protein n=1 Tax=Caenispirillum bisanense TaxID=414052 RepID=UPI0031E25E0B